MLLFPNAKINLGLTVENKRDDGYYNINTVIYPIPFYDVLEFLKAKRFSINIWGKNSNIPVKDNSLSKVFKLLREKFNIPPVKVNLLKNIPAGSGLGGGSSDAAFFLKGLNEYFNLNLSNTDLLKYAASLCGDCPFFINNRPAFIYGKGDIVEPLNINFKGYYLLLVFPDTMILTKNAYSSISVKNKSRKIKETVMSRDFDVWKKFLINDFETIIPENIKRIKNMLYDAGALYASMTGSGSTFYGIFKEKPLPENFCNYPFKLFEL